MNAVATLFVPRSAGGTGADANPKAAEQTSPAAAASGKRTGAGEPLDEAPLSNGASSTGAANALSGGMGGIAFGAAIVRGYDAASAAGPPGVCLFD